MGYGNDHSHHNEYADPYHSHDYADPRHDHDGDYERLHHRHYDLERETEQLRSDLADAEQRTTEVESELSTALGELTRRQERFEKHVAANLASLNEITAELVAMVAVLANPDEDNTAAAATTVGVLRALTFNLGYQFRGERAPMDWNPDVEWERLALATEADVPPVTAAGRG